jgi:hypothetical protein
MVTKGTMSRLVAAAAAVGGLLLFWRSRRRRASTGGRGRGDDGGLAGVREPRRPVPPTLVDAGAAVPTD